MASFNSLDARKATFLLAPILIASPVAGLRPMRAARFLTCNMPSPAIRIRSPFFNQTDEVVQELAPRAFRQLVLFSQACGELGERNRNLVSHLYLPRRAHRRAVSGRDVIRK